MRKKIIFSYDGSKFNGLQRQKNTRTVQKTIEEALSKIFEDDIELKASGRTDAGVHAVNQVAHFDIKKDIKGLKHKLNLLLNPDIVVKSVSNVNDDFHARLSVKKKEYVYKINIGEFDPIMEEYIYQYNKNLDIEKMKEAKDMEDFKNGNFIISDGGIEIMGVVSSINQLPCEGKRYGEAYMLSGKPHNIMIWTKNISTQKIGWIKLTL